MKLVRQLAVAAATMFAPGYVAAVSAADAPVSLRFSHFLPPSHPLQASFQDWANSLTKASGGNIKVTILPAEQLGKAFDHYDMASTGIADAALVGPGYQPGRFPIAAYADLPFLYNDGKKGSAAVDAWYRAYAAREMKDVHFCLGFIQYPATLHSSRKIVVPSDIKGLKVRPPNAGMAHLISLLGGTNVSAPPQQTRELIDRGAVDATFVPWGSTILFGIDKVAKYHLDTMTNAWFGVVVMNKAKYDGLSAAQKQAVDAHCNSEWAVKVAAPWADFEQAGRAKLAAEPGQQLTALTPD